MSVDLNTLAIELLPHIKEYKNKIFVVKYGGSIMENKEAQKAFLADASLLKAFGINLVIVHGGGPAINKWLKRANIESQFINGLRVTDEDTIEIVEMVLSGSVNKKLTAELNSLGVNAIGISGRDCQLITAKKKYSYNNDERIDIGFVGEVTSINKNFLLQLLNNDFIPVISPVGCDSLGNTYNINADYAAAAVACALEAEKLIIMTDIEGVYKDINDKNSLIKKLTSQDINKYIEEGIITGGMIPKMHCCQYALEKGAKAVHLIDGRKEHSLLLDTFDQSGTQIVK
ncbi:MAG: acetylglutamate kinase [Clostridiales bacterium]|uniref:acetylglutamate kinase n=1 Tax=Clostridium sp. N3C TaxID=1776758 RepID=UPI00092DF88E|nr:acetylglutamate kinase [Clostridium sp. N3C]NLZ49004.1 acetylglutamate kinase [Clostridiales bacterium]SCN23289.1 Acetylglutamate kinase [Clostridium sp. N3C]